MAGDEDQRERRFRRLYEANFRPVQAYAVNRLARSDDVADVVAEVFMIAWRRLADVPPPPHDRFWLYGTARRVISKRYRSASRWHNLLGRLAAERPKTAEWADNGVPMDLDTMLDEAAPARHVRLDGPDSPAAVSLYRQIVTQPAAAVPGPGQYVYVETIEGQRDLTGICVQTVRVWTAPDGSGREVASAPTGAFCHGGIPSQTFAKGQRIVTADLPTAPARLEQFIVRHFEGGGREDVAATFDFAGTFLQAGAPPPVRAALYRLIQSTPGIEALGPMTDRLGRHGIGVGFTEYGVRDVLIFDPATTAVLEREGIAVDPARTDMPPGEARFSAGEVINYTVYAASGVVNSIGTVPSAAA